MLFPQVRYIHRRKKQTEEQAKVVAALWGTEFNQFQAEPEFSVLLISGKLRKHACFVKKNLLIKVNLVKICIGDFNPLMS